MALLTEFPRLWPPVAASSRPARVVAARSPERADPAGQQRLLKGINRMALVRQLCARPGLSRADLAASVQLTKSTVGLLVRELIDEGWLLERESVATGDIGRRPTPLFIDSTRLVLLGAEIGIESSRVVATTLLGDLVGSARFEHGADRGAESCIRRLATALAQVHGQLDDDAQQVIGIGIGVPGGVDETTGFLHFAPNLGWRNVALGQLLEAALAGSALAGVPLFVQNEADVAALGELEFDSGTIADPLLYVSINHGVGAGVIVGDRLLIGSRGFAGEIGHTILQPDGPLCSCGRRGCAEALIGVRAMLPSTTRAAPPRWRPSPGAWPRASPTRSRPSRAPAPSSGRCCRTWPRPTTRPASCWAAPRWTWATPSSSPRCARCSSTAARPTCRRPRCGCRNAAPTPWPWAPPRSCAIA